MKRVRDGVPVIVVVLAVCAIVASLLVTLDLAADRYAVPWQHKTMWFEDEDGLATIRCDAFHVQFEGRSFGSHSSGGDYIVDGRYPYNLFRRVSEISTPVGQEVVYHYSQPLRLVKIYYRGHTIEYSHALGKLTIDGRVYSTSDGQVHVKVKNL